jgi:PAS domain S-box-containing protein
MEVERGALDAPAPTAPPNDADAAQMAAAHFLRFGPPAYVASLDGTLLFANPGYETLAKEILETEYDPAAPAFYLGEIIARIIADEKDVPMYDSVQRHDQEVVFNSHHYPILDDDGVLVAICGTYRESTKRAFERRELERVKERHEDIARLSFDIIWETDSDFNITYISPHVTDLLGFHPREMIGCNLFTLGTFEGESENRPTPENRSPFRNAPITVTHRNGRIKRFKISGLPMFSDIGAFGGFRGIAADVSAETEARESANISRERLTTAIENISEGLVLYDNHNRLVVCNNRFREYLVDASRVLFPGAPFNRVLQALDENAAIRAPDNCINHWRGLRARAEQDGEATLEIGLSNSRWLRVTDRPTEDGGIVSIVSDITETKEREDTLRAAKELAEQGSRSKSEFLANMSHELRTPLNAIIGFSEIMRAETLGPIGSPRYIEYLDDIIDSSQHLLGVINDILDVAKSEAGKIELNEEDVDLADEIKLTLRLFAEQAAEAEVNLKGSLGDTPHHLRADQRKIRQILLNLVSNAIKFTPPEGSVTISATLDANGAMDVTVEDTGIGIRKEDQAAALAPFGQVESSLSRRYEGTGLGLPLTQALVERHGGQLLLDSEPGRGTRITALFLKERVLAKSQS